MASHAELHGRHPCNNGAAGVDVTIRALNLVVARMKFMTEIDRLNRRGLMRIEAENGQQNRESDHQ